MNKGSVFLIKIVLVYAVWKLFHYAAHHGNYFLPKLWQQITHYLSVGYAATTSQVLSLFGYTSFSKGIAIFIGEKGSQILVEEHCLAIPAMVVFVGAVLLYPTQDTSRRWFIPFGLGMIALINIFRLSSLSIIFDQFNRQFFELNHSYIYLVLCYGMIGLLLWWWSNKIISQTEGNKAK